MTLLTVYTARVQLLKQNHRKSRFHILPTRQHCLLVTSCKLSLGGVHTLFDYTISTKNLFF